MNIMKKEREVIKFWILNFPTYVLQHKFFDKPKCFIEQKFQELNAFGEHLILHPLYLDLRKHIKVLEVLNQKFKFFNPEFLKLLDHRIYPLPP